MNRARGARVGLGSLGRYGVRCVGILLGSLAFWGASFSAGAQVAISEIMYHPVEEPAFNADGSPVLELYEDVHEFIELHNPGGATVDLAGWELAGGVSYSFPAGASLAPGQYLVVAKNPQRLAAVAAYGLSTNEIWGPWTGQLGNRRDTVRLRDARGQSVDVVSYSAEFPWAIGADAMGADEEWTGFSLANHQYRGRSLERVSFTQSGNDPANWLASPIPGDPSPGRPNAVQRERPRPVVTSLGVAQQKDEAAVIRKNEPAVVRCAFSATNELSQVTLEWFRDDPEASGEAVTRVPMEVEGAAADGRFQATISGQADRSVIRYRIRADRGGIAGAVSPRPDDPYAWHAYFVTPTRSSGRPIYDLLISSASLSRLASNISQSPRRVTSPDPPGDPRASWNATEPAVFVCNNVVYDIRGHYHGSRYNRNSGANSWQWFFPRYRKFNGVTELLVTDKGQDTIVGRALFKALGLPVSEVRWVDLYVNNSSAMQRLEQGEFDGPMLDNYHQARQLLDPDSELEPTGDIHKDTGTIDLGGEGPYGRGDGRRLSKPPYWTDLQMYDWTYPLQNHSWRGSYDFKRMIDAYWTARGDTVSQPNPNVAAMRAFFLEYWDVEEMLDYIALENWCCPWDDTTQNHFLWQRRNGKWGMLPWDMDAWFGNGDNTPASSSLFIGEVGDPNNNFRGPNFFKDGFIKAFRQELVERFFLLNNTLLHPDNLQSMGLSSISSFAKARFQTVNQRCDLGTFARPAKPVGVSPANGATAFPPTALVASAYGHSATPAPAHAKTLWELRAAEGTYSAPLWRLETTTNLTTVPISFTRLTFGETYYWRCTYFDANGHPSLIADESSFRFGPSPVDRVLVPIDAATVWKYDQSGTDRSLSNWTAVGFDDSAWASGAGLLAKEEATLPEPLRTPLTIGKTTYYFRHRFTFPSSPQGVKLRLRLVVDDGCVVYLNGRELYRLRMPDGAPSYATFASSNVGDGAYEGPFDVSAASLVTGENVVAVEVHQSNASSSDVTFGLSLEGAVPAAAGGVVLNEVAARNAGSVVQEGKTPDWIELYNSGSQTVDLAGYSLTDDVLRPGRFVFPAATLLASQSSLVVWCDDRTNAPGLHTGFGLNDRGQTLVLLAPDAGGWSVSDFVTFGLQCADLTLGRVPQGAGAWQLTQPTPGGANVLQAVASSAQLKINEWMAADAGADWFELYNPAALPVALGGLYLTDDFANPTNTRIPDLSFIGAQAAAVFQADGGPEQGADHVGFKLSASGEQLGLYATNGVTRVDAVTYGPQTAGVSEGRLPDGGSHIVAFPVSSTPGEANYRPLENVVVSELLAQAEAPFEPAMEFQNLGDAPVDLSGWWLSDDSSALRKFALPAGTALTPGGFGVVYAQQWSATASPVLRLDAAHGGELILSAVDATGALTGERVTLEYPAMAPGVALGRYPTSQGVDFVALTRPTFGVDAPGSLAEFRQGKGATNGAAATGPIAISEIMYHPLASGTNDSGWDEYVELCNAAASPVALYDPTAPSNTWRMRKAIEFEFPSDFVLEPGACVVLVSFDPVADPATLSRFQALYGRPASLLGPFRGRLNNAGDTIELQRPGTPLPLGSEDPGYVPYYAVDRVQYAPTVPWPAGADGSGESLQRVEVSAYGNEPLNWRAAAPTPGEAAGGARWRLEVTPNAAQGVVVLRASGSGTGTLVWEETSDLRQWTPLQTNQVTGGAVELSQPVQPSPSSRYYRVRGGK